MDVAWLVLDSLSYAATPFTEDGPDTMPNFASLAEDRGVTFDRAYSPGPSSPSSHGSFFTNELPSTTGMHEATPYFEGDMPTIAGALPDHRSLLISANPFIFNGLGREFDEVDDLRSQQYSVFPEATDPLRYTMRTNHDSPRERWIGFLFDDGKPIRSLVNGLKYKLWFRNQAGAIPRQLPHDEQRYQYAGTIGRRVRQFLDRTDGDRFVVANYMDVHPPFDASDEALDRFAPDETREDLPLEVSGQEVLRLVNEGDDEAEAQMTKLYHATIWDLDRHVTPLIEELLADETMVVVTADHGNWFRRREEFETELIHVPLVVFAPGEDSRCIDRTVNIRHLPSTTMNVLGMDDPFTGDSLLDIDDHQLSITESIHEAKSDSPVAARSGQSEGVLHDVAAIRGDSRVEVVDDEFTELRGSEADCAELRETIKEIRAGGYQSGRENIEYDDAVEERLEDLGYV